MFPVADIIPAAMLGPPQQTAVAEIPAQPKPRRASTRPKTNGKHPPMIAPNINPIHPELNILNFFQESELPENQNNFQHLPIIVSISKQYGNIPSDTVLLQYILYNMTEHSNAT